MFQFPGFPSSCYGFACGCMRSAHGVSHSDTADHRHLLLPAAFRNLSRPSSAPSAKASRLLFFQLDRPLRHASRLRALSVVHCLRTSTVRCSSRQRPPVQNPRRCSFAPRSRRAANAAPMLYIYDFVACFFCCLDSPPRQTCRPRFQIFWTWLPLPPVRACAFRYPGKLASKFRICGFSKVPTAE